MSASERKFGPASSLATTQRSVRVLKTAVSGQTLITSQFPVNQWHEVIADPTVADAILDRLVHNAYRIELKGESLRKGKTPPAENEN